MFNVKNLEDASKVCYENGGSLALIKDNKEINEIRKLFHQKTRLVRKAEYFYLHNDTANYFSMSNTETIIHHTKDTSCPAFQYNASNIFDFKVC